MKKIFVVIVVFFCVATLFARDVEVVAYGDTKAEAEENALVALQRYLYGSVVESYLGESTKSPQSNSSHVLVQQNSVSNVGGTLWGYNLSVEVMDNSSQSLGRYMATASIKSSESETYERYLKESAKAVLLLEAQQEPRDSETLTYYRMYLSSLVEYEKYFNAVAILKNGDVPDYGVKTSSLYVRQKYMNLLVNSENTIRDAIAKAQVDALSGSITQMQSDLMANIEVQQKLMMEQAEANAIAKEQEARYLTIQLEELVSGGLKRNLQAQTAGVSVDEMMSVLNEYHSQYQNASSMLYHLLAEEDMRYDSYMTSVIALMEARPYRITEMKDGKPLSNVKAAREKELDEYRKDALTVRESRIFQINRALRPVLADLENSYAAYIGSICLAGLSENMDSSNSSVSIGRFDGENRSWEIVLSKDDLSCTFNLTLSTISHETKPTIDGWASDYYEAKVVAYDSLLRKSFFDLYDVQLSLRVTPGSLYTNIEKLYLSPELKLVSRTASIGAPMGKVDCNLNIAELLVDIDGSDITIVHSSNRNDSGRLESPEHGRPTSTRVIVGCMNPLDLFGKATYIIGLTPMKTDDSGSSYRGLGLNARTSIGFFGFGMRLGLSFESVLEIHEEDKDDWKGYLSLEGGIGFGNIPSGFGEEEGKWVSPYLDIGVGIGAFSGSLIISDALFVTVGFNYTF